MSPTTMHSLLALTLVPLLAVVALRPAAEAGAGGRSADEPRLQLAVLKAEARQLVVHIDGP